MMDGLIDRQSNRQTDSHTMTIPLGKGVKNQNELLTPKLEGLACDGVIQHSQEI